MSAPAPLPDLPVTFRPTRTRAVLLTIGVVLFAVITAIALTLSRLNPGEKVSFIFTGALFFCGLLMLSRPKVVADQEGVTVVNLVSVHRLAWPQVLRVNLRVGDPWVYLDLADGTSLAALGIQPGIAKQHAIRDAKALRALVEEYGTASHG
ncbi:PH domain-containing protein [Streptomyces palmae]|uniref:PH domain-containing protein n=1 Tax=Streptomyces palmae TaxID=1701085 RepID=A0A4Z0GTK8_9ACTN|nr:PH domain-containing protein [Streptomyces palmae]TGB00041.1 PH domain-containing protein [Streptomyces palmae]